VRIIKRPIRTEYLRERPRGASCHRISRAVTQSHSRSSEITIL